MAIVIALSVFLPLYLGNQTTEPIPSEPDVGGTHYASSKDTMRISVDVPEDLWAQFGREVPSLKMEYEAVYYEKIIDRNDESQVLGASVFYEVFNDTTDDVEITVFPTDLQIDWWSNSNLNESFVVKDTTVKLSNQSGLLYDYYYEMYFEYGGLKFFVRVKGIDVIDLEEIIENII